MANRFRRILYLLGAPFRFIGRIFRGIKNKINNIQKFFTDEPQDTSLADTLSKTAENPEDILYHLNELRKHLLRAVLVLAITTALSFAFSQQILEILSRPLEGGLDALIAIDVTEPLSTLMRVSLLSGFALALPYIAFEILLFIAPGVSRRSRIWGILSIPVITIFFVGGMAFAYYVMLPTAIPFLLNIMDIQTEVRPSSYIGFVTSIMFWVGMAFEFPLVVFILAGMGLVNAKTLARNWRLAIIIIAFVSALITPTIDPVNMALVMGPLIALYFLSIALAYMAQRGRAEASEPEYVEPTLSR